MPNSQHLPANEFMARYPNVPVWVKTIAMPRGWVDEMHSHDWHQLIFPVRGIVQTQANQRQFLVPHTSALFVPAGVPHESVAITETKFIGLYLNPAYGRRYASQLRAVEMTPFFKALVLELRQTCQAMPDEMSDEMPDGRPERSTIERVLAEHEESKYKPTLRLLDVLHDQIHTDTSCSFQLLLPEDRRVKLMFERLTADPAMNWSLAQWGEVVGASERTLSRLFLKEFNTTFALWRQHLRLVYSLSLLDSSLPVQAIAHQVGYQNDSSYIKAFKARFGMTPQQFRQQGQQAAAILPG
ncbi:AraC family transcriptional regulator [Photobacterium sp. TY1-4]|uniref:AraC family transcriptional regulator n=1 Tax=Photobacterium sp. TY1-4 TaxID=2899122 RepID=UPI0021C15D3E|nr:helix-turn-helix transcriptional regulator [Photobacterium sp. TY1-4]UXI03599.1 helix-turn-helix transcriptional regulator [Photobacterium sp. TY1-4]